MAVKNLEEFSADWTFQMDYLKEMSSGLESALSKYGHTTVEADATIEPGGCVLMTEQGQIDGQIDIQVDRIAEAITIGERSLAMSGQEKN